jgi:hypothetical protein
MPECDPRIHHRRSIRLKGYDYAYPGAYFVTICTADRECTLGHVADGRMVRSKIGAIVRDCWRVLPTRFRHIDIDAWCVMPNHFHGIIFILDVLPGSEGGRRDSRSVAPPPQFEPAASGSHSCPAAGLIPIGTGLTAGSLSVIVRAFKASSTRRANQILWFPQERGHTDKPELCII